MPTPPTECPAPDVLEGVAAGTAASRTLANHLSQCASCRDALQRIRDDNQFLVQFAVAGALPRCTPATTAHDIDIPGYQVVREIHRGGQGVVYLALQHSTKRDVAIKVMRQGPFATLADRSRFEREVETLAKLDHPNIVAVHDAGVAAGFHYFVMDYIDGKPLDEGILDFVSWMSDSDRSGAPRRAEAESQADQPTGTTDDDAASLLAQPDAREHRALDPRFRITATLGVFIKVCDAVNAAHLRGVIHRDLKPSNIRVDQRGEPHVLDFGLAKPIDAQPDSAMTRTGQFVGSLPWASPEQIEGDSARVDLRTDVYSLGAILYQLLTGSLPFDTGSNLRDALDSILLRDPPRPSTVVSASGGPRIDDELDTIVLKCLSKDRDRRYQGAGDLARDLRHYLAGEPIDAKRDSALYVLRKTLRRHRLPFAVAGAFVVLLAAFAVTMALAYRRASRLEQEATRSAVSLAELLTQSSIERGRMAGMLGNMQQAEQLLWEELLTHREPGEGGWVRLNEPPGPPDAYWALWELYRRQPCRRTLALPPIGGRLISVADDGRSIWTMEPAGLIRKFDAAGQTLDSYAISSQGEVSLGAINPAGDCLLTSDGQRYALWCRDAPHEPLLEIPVAGLADSSTIAIAASGKHVAVIVNGTILVSNMRPFKETGRFAIDGAELVAVALSNDDRRIAGRDRTGGLHIWNLASGKSALRSVPDNSKRETLHTVGPLLFSPDDQRLADTWWAIPGRVWDLTVDPPTPTMLNETPASYRVPAFSPDGRVLAIGDVSGAVQVFDTLTGKRLSSFVAHSGRARSVCFSGDGQGIWTCGDASARHWDSAPDAGTRVVRIDQERFHSVDIAPDGRSLIAGGVWGKLTRVDTATLAPELCDFGSDATVSCVAFSPDGRYTAAATYSNLVCLWDRASPAAPRVEIPHPNRVSYLTFSPDGERIASGCDDFAVRIWRTADARLERQLTGLGDRVPQVAFDPSGQRLAIALRDGGLRVWDLAAGNCETWAEANRIPLRAVRFAPDGRWLATGGADRSVTLWDADTRRPTASLIGHNQEIYCLDISPSGDLIASGDSGGAIRLWHAGLRRPLATLDGHTGSAMALRFSADGRTLVSASLDGTLRINDLLFYATHIAGNLDVQLERVRANQTDSLLADRWRRWAELHRTGRR